MQPNPEDFDMNFVETPFFKEWTVLQIEGEDPIPVETAIDSKISPAKKPVAKPNSKTAIEEVIDNRPRIIQLRKDVAEENGGLGFRFTDKVAIKFSKIAMNIQIIENEKVVESI